MFNVCQHGRYEDKFEDKKRLFEVSTDAEILQDCKKSSRACRGHSRTSHL